MKSLASTLLPFIFAFTLCGCIIVPQGELVDGTPAPNKVIRAYFLDGRIKRDESQARDVAQMLMACDPHLGVQWKPLLYENIGTRELAILYTEKCRAYGVTLNQHFLYLPMPMFGAEYDSQSAAVFLGYDQKGVLKRWRYVSEPKNLSDVGWSAMHVTNNSARSAADSPKAAPRPRFAESAG